MSSKCIIKQRRQLANINNTSEPGTAIKCTVQWWFRKEILKRRPEPWRWEVQCLAIRNWQQPTERIIETGPLTTTREVAQELSIDHPMVVWHLKQIGTVKKLYKWVPHELTKNQKNHRFEMSPSLILHNNNGPILWHMAKSGIYMTADNDQLSGWTEKLQSTSQSQACTKKRLMITVWWSSASLIHWSFLNSSETITSEKYTQQINEMHQKLQRLLPTLINRKGPRQHLTTRCTTSASKVEWIGPWSFASSTIFTWSLTNHLPLHASWQLFTRKTLPQPAGWRKYFSRLWITKHNFYPIGIKYLFLIGKNVLIVMVPILINKDVFEPSYNDLKFRVGNHSYFYTRLIKTKKPFN